MGVGRKYLKSVQTLQVPIQTKEIVEGSTLHLNMSRSNWCYRFCNNLHLILWICSALDMLSFAVKSWDVEKILT